MSPLQNFKNYRELLANARLASKPTFPYLALILRDITFAHENPNKLSNPAAATVATAAAAKETNTTLPKGSSSSSQQNVNIPATESNPALPPAPAPSTPQHAPPSPSSSNTASPAISPQPSSDNIEEKLLNFNKIEILGRQILEVKHFQSLPFTQLVEVDDVVQSYFRDLQIVSKEEELYRLSYKAEPRAAAAPAPTTSNE